MGSLAKLAYNWISYLYSKWGLYTKNNQQTELRGASQYCGVVSHEEREIRFSFKSGHPAQFKNTLGHQKGTGGFHGGKWIGSPQTTDSWTSPIWLWLGCYQTQQQSLRYAKRCWSLFQSIQFTMTCVFFSRSFLDPFPCSVNSSERLCLCLHSIHCVNFALVGCEDD